MPPLAPCADAVGLRKASRAPTDPARARVVAQVNSLIDQSNALYLPGELPRGAEVARQTRVTALTELPSGEWDVETDRGTVRAEIVVNAAGIWGREVGRMAGVELPIVPMQRQYLVTDTVPELAAAHR